MLVIVAVALLLRVAPPYHTVFAFDWVRFGEHDPWYHMRLVESLVQNFPNRIAFDPFTFFPYGQDVWFAPFYDLFLGFVIWVVGAGSPSQHLMEVVGAYFPAVLGALTTVPVYFVGKELFNRGAGLLSAGVIAILPGEFLLRSLLGFSDHHVAEVLFSATAVLFFILAIKSARQRGTTFSHLRHREWRSFGKPVLFALVAGIALGMYLLSWVGGLVFVGIIGLYAVVQYLSDHLRGKSTDYLCIVGILSFVVALVMLSPFGYVAYQNLCMASLAVGIVVFAASTALSRLMTRQGLRRGYYPLALAGLGLIGFGAVYLIVPSLVDSMLARLSVFTPDVTTRTITEVQPLLFPRGVFSLSTAWQYFTTSFFIALVSLGLIVWAMFRERNADQALLVVWSLVMLAASFSQVRFAYYYAVNVALLAGFFSARLLRWSGFFKLGIWAGKEQAEGERASDSKKKTRAKRKAERKRPSPDSSSVRYLLPLMTAVVVFFGVFYPNIGYATATAARPAPGPSDDWHSALVWMRHETPDPFGDPDFYYHLYARPPVGERYQYPASAYGVMSWWDYGHWITYIAHRIPNSNPHQVGARQGARYFISQDETSANDILDNLGSRYVILDHAMAMAMAKFYAMTIWGGEDESRFFEPYYSRGPDGQMRLTIMYYPEYYRSMCSRLYNFGGKAMVPKNTTWVISYVERSDRTGTQYKEISSAQSFATYDEAVAYLDTQSSPNYRLVGIDPFASPVPLEPLEHYEQVYASASAVAIVDGRTISEVQIFEYKPQGVQ